ncbi:MAG: pyruvate formate-lyase activating enzyme [Deltaproteobacteria bacterium SG8_13]|nr:MAG: pyruvate formate-lyase activating enzyme [Deltaproteobacteria bacterium SG8_13]
MSRILLLDIGAGTLDVLYHDSAQDLHYKAVVRSPVRTVAEKIDALPGNLVVTGGEMGGGPVTDALRERARQSAVIMSASSAATLHHNPDVVRSWNIEIVSDAEAENRLQQPGYSSLVVTDIDAGRIEQMVKSFGVAFAFDVVGVCAQDHGVPPAGVSHLDYRHRLFRDKLDDAPYPHAVLFSSSQVPATMNRLTTIARSAERLPTSEVFVMDSGMAAILGASLDMQARRCERIVVLDIATSHTVCAALEKGEICGFFEYHTRDISLSRLESLLRELTDGKLSHEQVLAEGGHGAYIRRAFGFGSTEAIIATGPKRRLLEDTQLPISFGAPFGDNMMTGTVGLLEAIRRQKQMAPISYV